MPWKPAGCAPRNSSSSASSVWARCSPAKAFPLKALRQQIRLMAPTNGRVLIYGESGTGKELIARAIHAESLRRDRVFVELNCAAIPEAHIEAELFGYRYSAQPGGPTEQRGTLERADGGTLFLDEVGDMSLKTQAKVLSALDDQLFTPVGGTSRCALMRASSPPPTRTSKKRSPRAISAKISSTGSMWFRFLCRRSESASRIFRCWPANFCRVWPPVRSPAHGDRRRRAGDAGPVPLAR